MGGIPSRLFFGTERCRFSQSDPGEGLQRFLSWNWLLGPLLIERNTEHEITGYLACTDKSLAAD